MNIGVFDSGLGGLYIAQSLMDEFPFYNYVYLGDTKRVPYGNRSPETVLEFTRDALRYLFEERSCFLVVVACNTASAEAVELLRNEYAQRGEADRHIMGVLIPTAERVSASGVGSVGVIATSGTVRSEAYKREIQRVSPHVRVYQVETPLLVPLIENDGLQFIEPVLKHYLTRVLAEKVEGIVLGCTHYVSLKGMIRGLVGPSVTVFSQDELLPEAMRNYLSSQPRMEASLSRDGQRSYLVTDNALNPLFSELLTLQELNSVDIVQL